MDANAYDAWLFDLDGVITDTASVHASAWKRAFDAFLEARAKAEGEPFRPFDAEADYLRYVDGKPRYDGVDSFLRSRGIELTWGDPEDEAGAPTVCGLGNNKNALFNQVLEDEGVEVFASSVELIEALRERGKRIAVVTSSKNCDRVLEVAGLRELFDAKVDGNVAAELALAGKPDPETYATAARFLEATPARSVVVEDAISGVEAGKAGGFGLVVGVARHDDPNTLQDSGANVVVHDLGELQLA
ncbi:MAG: beta-phosphoglucomutase family hydrolase [Geminicoccaceae bacterium]|nr:MAG: beta-phosphoglucomutase family hydrolase [Geminicoccaceae bacterium]